MVAENEQEIEVRAGAGEVWDDFVAYTVKNSWYGAENLSLIPVKWVLLPFRISVRMVLRQKI